VTDLTDRDLELPYPCKWVYKVIGGSEGSVRRAVHDVVQGRKCEVTLSRTSSKGKYCCLNVRLTVYDAADRMGIYRALSSHPLTKIVL